jgi:hypothetical protein
VAARVAVFGGGHKNGKELGLPHKALSVSAAKCLFLSAVVVVMAMPAAAE